MSNNTEARQKILSSAELLFAAEGYEATSMRQLAKAAEVNIAMVSYYFGSKEELYRTLVRERMLPFRSHLQDLIATETDTVWLKMEQVIEGYAKRIFNNNCLHQIIYREMSLQNSPIRAIVAETVLSNRDSIALIVQQGQAAGEFRTDIDTHLLMTTITGTIVQMIKAPQLSLVLMGKNPENDSLFTDENQERVVNYLKELIKNYILIR